MSIIVKRLACLSPLFRIEKENGSQSSIPLSYTPYLCSNLFPREKIWMMFKWSNKNNLPTINSSWDAKFWHQRGWQVSNLPLKDNKNDISIISPLSEQLMRRKCPTDQAYAVVYIIWPLSTFDIMFSDFLSTVMQHHSTTKSFIS